MYFPYFRGRQYELLALKELANGRLMGNNVLPVVEPIKLTSTFDGFIKAFVAAQLSVGVLFNPAVGELTNALSIFEQLFSRCFSYGGAVVPAMLLSNSTESVLPLLFSKGFPESDVLTILNKRDFLKTYADLFSHSAPKFTLCPDERQLRRAVNQSKVLFEDKFNKKDRNADYPEDEFFSDDHLFFKDDNYVGFGDYSIVGDEYIETGFAPYAVAIHIVYFDNENMLRIRHFISDSNDDISDVAGKYHEAVSKLATWYHDGQQQQQQTTALATFLTHAETGYYPGLPTVKKLSIMHHLELMGKFLDGGVVE